MTITQARYIQANPSLFSAAKQAEANAVAGVKRDLRTILRTKTFAVSAARSQK